MFKSTFALHRSTALVIAVLILAFVCNSRAGGQNQAKPSANTELSTICQFETGPRAGQTQDYAPRSPIAVGRRCEDGQGSFGHVIAAKNAAQTSASDPRYILNHTEMDKLAEVEAYVPDPPTVFTGDGQRRLCYELYITNMALNGPWILKKVEVVAEGSNAILMESTDTGLASALIHPSNPTLQLTDRATLPVGEHVLYYAWVDLPKEIATPKRIKHRLTLKSTDEGTDLTIEAAEAEVGQKPREIAPPLRGGNWWGQGGPANNSSHRRTWLTLNGLTRIPQRYATDWEMIDKDGNDFKGDISDNHSYYCYGKEAYSVADGVISEVKDGIPENVPRSGTTAVPITLETIAGNHIIIDLGGGVYALYCHLQPGSIRVKLGDHIKAGAVIGLVGNSGNAALPHLHFQLMDRNSPLASQGLPFSLPSFKLLGRKVERRLDWFAQPGNHSSEIPLRNEIVAFP